MVYDRTGLHKPSNCETCLIESKSDVAAQEVQVKNRSSSVNRTPIRLLAAGVLLLLILGPGLSLAGPRTGRDRALNSAVQIIVDTQWGTTRRCTGYVFNHDGHVLTTFHAVSDAASIHVFHPNFGVFDVERVRRIDPRADIAVLIIAGADLADLASARLADSRTLSPDDALHIVHHPIYTDGALHDTRLLGTGYARQFESCYTTDHYANELLMLEVAGPFDAGSAGGLVCDENFDVVGILIGGGAETDGGRLAYALSSSYFSPLLISTYDVAWDNLRTGHHSDADYFDRFFGPSPQPVDYSAPMTESYLAWFAPIYHTQYADFEFTYEINDKIDKNWFYTAGLEIDGRPINEWSAWRVFPWEATINPWDMEDGVDRYMHFDADSLFSKRIYVDRDTEERIMTRHILVMPLEPGPHTIRYENKGANYKLTGMRRRRIDARPAEVELIDIEGLSLVSMLLLPNDAPATGEGEPVRYELERRPLGGMAVNDCIRRVRYPVEF